MCDISVIITAHREGILAGPAIRSARKSIALVEAAGALVEVIIVLDNSDPRTIKLCAESLGDRATIIETQFGDPALSRNRGVEAAIGKFATFLDADDLWSENWLNCAWQSALGRPDAVWHADCLIGFGNERLVWWHIDSEGPLFDPMYLKWRNYWDAMSFASTEIYRLQPFRANDLSAGFGHEDWHWNVQTYSRGVAHKPVRGTIHFKRRRNDSQMSAVARANADTIWLD